MVAGHRPFLGYGALGMLGLMGAALRATDYGRHGVGIDPVEPEGPKEYDWHVHAYNSHLERQAIRKRIRDAQEAEYAAKLALALPQINAAEEKRRRKAAKRLQVSAR